ncbi:hypothetical protein IP92_05070 [Pseudoduganella flava]|uniref:Uncharacterized protein n=1 Tax=Pseudoduganella flava TaxID=871742 RepID=A0A562PGC0_9BURK|nr:hypothetical protein IP92_05070 [Pseudoduganella flava]
MELPHGSGLCTQNAPGATCQSSAKVKKYRASIAVWPLKWRYYPFSACSSKACNAGNSGLPTYFLMILPSLPIRKVVGVIATSP